MTNKKQISLLLLPIIILILWAIYHEINSNNGTEVTLNITGYDPRDLLSGHYLTYQINYPKINIAQCQEYRSMGEVFLNLDTGEISDTKTTTDTWLMGRCGHNNFNSGLNKFYIPQKYAKELDNILRTGKFPASIKVMITNSGKGYVKQLYFDGMPWQQFLENSDTVEQNSSSIDSATDVMLSSDNDTETQTNN